MAIAVSQPAVKEMDYEQFLNHFNYRQDHHVTVCGPTGCGKSVLITETIIPRRTYQVYFSTKPRDATVESSALTSEAWGWTDDPDKIHPWVRKKWVVGLKKFGDPDRVEVQHRQLFQATLKKCFPQPGWAIIGDEGRYLCDPEYLGLRSLVAKYYIQGRSDDKSMVLATQRPRHVPLEAFDQATHLFFFNDEDLQNVIRMAEAAGGNRKQFQSIIPTLGVTEDEGGHFLYYNRLTKQKIISKVEM